MLTCFDMTNIGQQLSNKDLKQIKIVDIMRNLEDNLHGILSIRNNGKRLRQDIKKI